MSDSETRVWLDRPNRLVFLDDSGLYHLFEIASGRCVQTFRYTAFRDIWTPLVALESGTVASNDTVGGDLPEPDATNPEHCKWAAQLLEAIVEDVPESEYEQVREVDNTADRLRWRADRLDAARSAEREREQRIEEAAEIVCDASAVLSGEATWNKAPDWWKDTFREAARALDAAGLLRGGGRGE